VNIPSAVPAAVSSPTVTATASPSTDENSGAQFASQLSGVGETPESAEAWRSAGPAKPRKDEKDGSNEPKANTETAPAKPGPKHPLWSMLPGATPSRSVLASASKGVAPKQNSAQRQAAVPGELMQMPDVPVLPAPAPQLPEMPPPVTDATAGDNEPGIPAMPAASHSETVQPAEPATPNETAPRLQEMAFAARIQPAESVDRSSLSAEMASAAAVASANKKVVAAGEDESSSVANATTVLGATTAIFERHGESGSPALQGPTATASHPTQAPALLTESAPKASAPLKDISLQVAQLGKERVDVRVVQQGSDVQVSVHSGDSNLTSGLRQGLPELQSRLEESGYRSEMWRPGVSTTPLTASPSSQASTNQSRGGDGQAQHGGSQQESGRRNQNQSNQPRWFEEMESSLNSGEQSAGGFHGIGS